LPDSTNKLLSRWQGPGLIVDFKPPHSYLIEVDGGQRRWLHANKLRRYHARVQSTLVGNCAITYESDEDFGTLPFTNSEYDKSSPDGYPALSPMQTISRKRGMNICA